jgi:hypothetical protein
VSPAQQRALAQAAEANGPVKLNTASAVILHAQYGYLDRVGGLWQITDLGARHLEAERQRKRHQAAEEGLSRVGRDWAERVEHWLCAHERLGTKRDAYTLLMYARHVAACDHDSVEPGEPPYGTWTAEAKTWVENETRAAATLLKDYDKASARAKARGVSVEVEYTSAPKVPRSRTDAADAAVAASGVVSLTTYRERRPANDDTKRGA